MYIHSIVYFLFYPTHFFPSVVFFFFKSFPVVVVETIISHLDANDHEGSALVQSRPKPRGYFALAVDTSQDSVAGYLTSQFQVE